MANCHSVYAAFWAFQKQIRTKAASEGCTGNLNLMLRLFAVHDLLKNPVPLFECGYLSPAQHKNLKLSY